MADTGIFHSGGESSISSFCVRQVPSPHQSQRNTTALPDFRIKWTGRYSPLLRDGVTLQIHFSVCQHYPQVVISQSTFIYHCRPVIVYPLHKHASFNFDCLTTLPKSCWLNVCAMPLNTVVALIWTPTCFAEVAVATTMTTQMISMIMDQTEILTQNIFYQL